MRTTILIAFGLLMVLGFPKHAQATEILPFTGVYGTEVGCSRYFGRPTVEGIAVDRAGVEGNEWFCTWFESSFQRTARDDQWIEVFNVDAICFVEGTGKFVSGEVMRNTDGSRLRLVMPEVFPDTAFPSCRTQ